LLEQETKPGFSTNCYEYAFFTGSKLEPEIGLSNEGGGFWREINSRIITWQKNLSNCLLAVVTVAFLVKWLRMSEISILYLFIMLKKS
jgi:hypothetical protein